MAKLWSWDVEATGWDNVVCAVGISDEGDVERWEGPGCLERVSDFMDQERGTWVAHAGGIYDTLLLSAVRPRPWRELVMSGSAVLCAKDGTLKVRDSFRAWLSGLKKVGEYLEAVEDAHEKAHGRRRHPKGHWLKKDVDRKRIAQLTPEERLAYCESDTAILQRALQLHREYLTGRGAAATWTAGSAALALLEALEPASWKLLGRHQLDLEEAVHAGEVVRGARVERWGMGRVDGVHVYDFKSAYPASYATEPVGIGARRVHPGDLRRYPGTVWRARWVWPWRDRIPPVLDQLTGAGAGACEGWLVPEELEALESCGVKVTLLDGWAPEMMAPIGQVFVRDLYAEKERGSFFGKCFLNSLHGKFSESPIRENWRSGGKPTETYAGEPVLVGDYWRFLTASVDKRGLVPRHIQPLAAAHILGRTRVRLWRAIQAVVDAGGEVYYCDTDSIHCNLPPERMPMVLGKQLGQLAHEGGPFVGFYVAPKAYALCDPTTGKALKGALKGMPWRDLADGVRVENATPPLYRQARDEENGRDYRREVFEEALRRPETGVRIMKEGIASWVQGLKKGGAWRKIEQPRTLRPQERSKVFRSRGQKHLGDGLEREGTTVWAYSTPAERLALKKNPGPDADNDRENAEDAHED